MLTASLLLAAMLSTSAESDPTIPLPHVWEKIPLPEVLEPKPADTKELRPPAAATDGTSHDRYGAGNDRYGKDDDRYGTAEDRYGSGDQADRYAVPRGAPAAAPAALPAGPIIQPPEPVANAAPLVAAPVHAPLPFEPDRRAAPNGASTNADAPQKFQPAPGSVSLPDKVDSHKRPWPVAPASASEPAAPAPAAEPAKPWLPLTASLLALVASLATNVYLGWVWLGTRNQYRDLARERMQRNRGAPTAEQFQGDDLGARLPSSEARQ